MLRFLKDLKSSWDNWVGDRDMERSIRRHLTDHGYFGSSAKFRGVRLVAVERPGWVQVYRFEVRARINPDHAATEANENPEESPEYHELFGLVKDDTRHHLSSVRVFNNESERRQLFGLWSEGLICLRGAKGI